MNLLGRFCSINVEDIAANLSVDISSVKFTMGNCKNLKMESSFCKNMSVANVDEAELRLSSSEVSVNEIKGDLNANASFSNIEIAKIGANATLKLSSSTFEASDIKELTLEGSFVRSFVVNNIQKAVIEKFSSSEFKANNMAHLQIHDASFSTFRVAMVENLSIEKSSSSKFYLTAANVVEAPKCSFTDFSIGQLKKRFVTKSSSGSIKLNNVTSGFEKISIDGQFVNIDIDMQENASYKIEAELEFPNYQFHDITYSLKEKNLSNEKMSGMRGGDKNTNSEIRFDCKSCSITLN
ncbi:MAG: hypothetical protein HC831_12685 [Chloroflexia bacterium]|nr:hypothetical protein [Chloroflexia bacterium]